jgi:hypothetical protein
MVTYLFLIGTSVVKDDDNLILVFKNNARSGSLALGSNSKSVFMPREERSLTSMAYLISIESKQFLDSIFRYIRSLCILFKRQWFRSVQTNSVINVSRPAVGPPLGAPFTGVKRPRREAETPPERLSSFFMRYCFINQLGRLKIYVPCSDFIGQW